MLFPIGDDHIKGNHKPIFTYLFILINCYVFWQENQLTEAGLKSLFETYGAIPVKVLAGENLHTLFTSMFLHGGWSHLIGNMLFLWIFGDNIEIAIGNFRFLLFYVIGGIFAALVHCIVLNYSQIPCVGASGAIAAVLGAYLVMFPASKIKIFFLLFFTTFRVSAFVFLGIWIAQQLFAGWASLGPKTADTSGVGYWAHIGGFAFGIVCGFFFRARAKKAYYFF